MPPKDKIAANRSVRKDYCDSPACVYCWFSVCSKHSKYFRKWFYQTESDLPSEPETVQRYKCGNPMCKRTFSILPENVLPYCHFHLDSLLSISRNLTEGKSRYWLAKNVWKISLRVLLRVDVLIRSVTPLLEAFYREVTGVVTSGFQELVVKIREKVCWRDFTRRWFHGVYPCRASTIFNSHNLAIKRF